MSQDFYHYAIRFADPDATDPLSRLANQIKADPAFPRHATSFEDISAYIEGDPNYSRLATVFDDMWVRYAYDHLT